jgi:hypothetical protein
LFLIKRQLCFVKAYLFWGLFIFCKNTSLLALWYLLQELRSWLSLVYFGVHNWKERWEIGLEVVGQTRPPKYNELHMHRN